MENQLIAEVKLSPCPFCGGQGKIKKRATTLVSCISCSATTFQKLDDEESAIRNWNKRATWAELFIEYDRLINDDDYILGMKKYEELMAYAKSISPQTKD